MMIRLVIIIVSASFLISGCERGENNEEYTCNFTSFYYTEGIPKLLGAMSGDYLLIGFDTINGDHAIREFIKSFDFFDQDYDFEIKKWSRYRYKHVILKFRNTQNCLAITRIISEINKNDIVDFTHFTIQTDNCQDLTGWPMGEKCVYSYHSTFYVILKDTSDLSDLNNTILETNTFIKEQRVHTFILIADKNSKGDAMQMANYFYETGLFASSQPGINKNAVE